MAYIRAVLVLVLIQGSSSYSEPKRPCTLSDETCLMKYLKANMEKEDIDVRPAFNQSETTHIKFGIAMTRIDSMEPMGELYSRLIVSCWFRHSWIDQRLSWDPEDFGGLTEVRIPIKYIWKPDIVFYNNLVLTNEMDEEALAMVSSEGLVLWIPMGKMTVKAQKDASSWLSDTFYHVAYKFGSWTYDGFKLDIDFYDDYAGIALTDYVMHNMFEVVDQSAVKNVKYYPCCAEPYPDLTFSMRLKEH